VVAQSDKRSVLEMIAEFLRELAVLIFVFVPLELWRLAQESRHEFDEVLIWTAAIAIVSLGADIVLERMRP
jgi:hypothetical protein